MRTKLSPAILAACFTAGFLDGQPTPGSQILHPLPMSGSLIINPSGSVYAVGGNGPVTPGAAQTKSGGGGIACFFTPGGPTPCSDAYLAKADASGNLVYGTLLGGPTNDSAYSGAVDSVGNLYVAGLTGGSFPTTPNAAIPVSTTSRAFVAKLNADGSKFLYSTYLPDVLVDQPKIALDSQGNAYIVGLTASLQHIAMVKLSADGSSIVYTKVLAGARVDWALAVVADAAGNAFVTGWTQSPDFPVTSGVVQPQLAGHQNAFLTKLDPAGNIVFSTFLGGSGYDAASIIQLDPAGNIYLAGSETSLDFPTTPGSYQASPLVPAWSTQPGGFFAKLSPDASALLYSTYITSRVNSIAQDAAGGIYIAADGGQGLQVTANAPQPCLGNSTLLHIDSTGTLIEASYSGASATMTIATDGSILAGQINGFEQIRFGDPGWTAPACMTPILFSSANLASTAAVPGQFVTLAGFGIGPEIGVSAQPGPDGTPTTLGGVTVLFDGKPAPIVYAQSRQVNVQAPFELNGQSSTTITLEYNGVTFGPLKQETRFAYPGLFRLQPNVSPQAYAVNQDGTFNSASNPAPRGSVIALWGTGFGQTIPGCSTGALNAPGPANIAGGLTVEIEYGGPVQYAGGAPTLACGIFQINMLIPTDKPPGVLAISPQVVFNDGLSYTGSDVQSLVYIK